MSEVDLLIPDSISASSASSIEGTREPTPDIHDRHEELESTDKQKSSGETKSRQTTLLESMALKEEEPAKKKKLSIKLKISSPKESSSKKSSTAINGGVTKKKPSSSKKSGKPSAENTRGGNKIDNTKHEPEDLPWVAEENLTNIQPERSENIPANHPTIAFLVMFQSRFYPLFEGVTDLGPQDIEAGVMSETLSEGVEQLLCRLLSLVLNRKKPIEPGRYARPLEELQALLPQLGISPNWPDMKLKAKDCVNELSWQDRLEFLRMLAIWALSISESVRQIASEVRAKGPSATKSNSGTLDKYFKPQQDQTEIIDPSIYLGTEVEPIGRNGRKHRYYLIQGNGDTCFRLYETTNPRLRNVLWESVASTKEEVEKLIGVNQAEQQEEEEVDMKNGEEYRLSKDNSPDAKKLKKNLEQLLILFGEGEIRRKKNEEKLVKRKALLQRAEQARRGEGLYVGRTRGKRVNYNVDLYDEEDDIDPRQDEGEEYRLEADQDDEDEEGGIPVMGTRRSARLRGNAALVQMKDNPDAMDVDFDEIVELPSKMVVLKYSSRTVGNHKEQATNSEPVKLLDSHVDASKETTNVIDYGLITEPSISFQFNNDQTSHSAVPEPLATGHESISENMISQSIQQQHPSEQISSDELHASRQPVSVPSPAMDK